MPMHCPSRSHSSKRTRSGHFCWNSSPLRAAHIGIGAIEGRVLSAVVQSLFGAREMALENGLGVDISLLQIHTPVFQLLERDRQPGDRATHEGAGPHDAKIAVEISDLGLAGHG